MTYREETEGLKTRLAETERELSEAREKIARLEGASASPAGKPGELDWLTGAPKVVRLERELPFEVSDEGYEAIAELLRARLPGQNPRFPGMGQVSQIGRTLSYTSPMVQVRISRGRGRTTVQLESNHRAARVGVILGSFYGTILGSLLVTGVLKGLGITPLSLILAIPMVLVLMVTAGRRLAQGHVAKRGTSLAGIMEAIGDLGAKHARKKGARIDVHADAEEEADEAEAEADAVEVTGSAG